MTMQSVLITRMKTVELRAIIGVYTQSSSTPGLDYTQQRECLFRQITNLYNLFVNKNWKTIFETYKYWKII